jgi:hypothetical protein
MISNLLIKTRTGNLHLCQALGYHLFAIVRNFYGSIGYHKYPMLVFHLHK